MTHPEGKYAWTVKVGEKGQIVIPKGARDLFDIKPGDTLVLLGDEKKGIAIPPKSAFSQFAAAIFERLRLPPDNSDCAPAQPKDIPAYLPAQPHLFDVPLYVHGKAPT